MKKSFLYAILLGWIVVFAVVKPPLFEKKCEGSVVKDVIDTYTQKCIQELIDYIKAQKKVLDRIPLWIMNDTFLTIFSELYDKGSVTIEEIKMLKNFSDGDCALITPQIDWSNVQKKAECFIEKNIALIENKNKLHDALYEYLSEHNAIILGYQQKDRKSVICAMYKDQSNPDVKKAFLFGIAVTIEVEKQVEKKRG